jgi:predicted nucleotidyltransferase
MRRPKDRDFLETIEGLIFCVVGYLHPSDRFTSYLKYAPNDHGKWKRNNVSYKRMIPYYHVSQVEKTYLFLQERYPDYLYFCPVRNIIISSVPIAFVKTYYKPRERLQAILEEPRDKLEWKLTDLITILCGLSGLDSSEFGITGSILTQNHNPDFSDIDITVYGLEAARVIQETIIETRKEESLIQPYNSDKKEIWSRNRSSRHSLSIGELMYFAERRWNYGVFRDTYFSIHPVRTNREIIENYGDNTYEQIGEIEGKAIISDSSESIFLPATYRIENVDLKGKSINCIERLVSFEGLYRDLFDPGDKIKFQGLLEHVTGKDPHHRIVIGGAGSKPCFIKRAV